MDGRAFFRSWTRSLDFERALARPGKFQCRGIGLAQAWSSHGVSLSELARRCSHALTASRTAADSAPA